MITKYENSENVPYLEITQVVLIHFNAVNNNHQKNSGVLYPFVHNKSFGQLLVFLPKLLHFKKHLIQNFHILKYGLLIKILVRWR